MRRQSWFVSSICYTGFTCCVLSCSGTETGNPPVAFDSTDCKSHGEDSESFALVAKATGRASAVDNPRYDGLTCFVWQRASDDRLRIEVTNHSAGCNENTSWEPRAELDAQTGLKLSLDNPSCTSARCGSCLYDLSFTVIVPADQGDLRVRLYGDACAGDPQLEEQAVLPLATQPEGEICRYADFGALQWHACKVNTGGSRFSPCTGVDDCFELGSSCRSDLVCTEQTKGEPRCLPPCESDVDCALYPGTHCEQATCRP